MHSLLTMNYAMRTFATRPSQCHKLVMCHLAAYSSKPVEQGSSANEPRKAEEKPLYATKEQFRANLESQRASTVFTAETGVKPTNWQRRFLVLTNLYRNTAEIPEYIASGTMQRMHNRMRVVFIIVACTYINIRASTDFTPIDRSANGAVNLTL
uniref:Uncharacterized protein n=1 Tax=Ascaris lumbricoides TaxID=6252 RepID=A0A0M3I2D6_ASCLU